MTINQLIKKLEKIQKKYGKRLPVVIDMEGATNSQNPECSHMNVTTVDVEFLNWLKNDSFLTESGLERMKLVVTLCQR